MILKFKICTLIYAFFCCINLFTYAQGPDTLWTRYFGYANDDKAYSIHITPDSGYVIVGYVGQVGADVYIVRINSLGDSLWARYYGGNGDQRGYSVDVTTDGGYVVGAGAAQGFYLLRLSPSGDTLWTRTYSVGGGPAYSVQQTSDGGFIMGGAHGYHAMLIKTDSLGYAVWIKEYTISGNDNCFSVIQTSDGGYLFGGYAFFNNQDFLFVKTNSQGDTLWTRVFSTAEWEVCHAVMETSDHYYIGTGGFAEEIVRWPADPEIIKLDTNGNLIWEQIVAMPNDNTVFGIAETPDNQYILAGRTYEDQGFYNFFLMKMNTNGDTLWSRSYSRGGDEWAQSVAIAPDGGYLMCGWGLHSPNWYDVFLIRTNPQGMVEEYQKERPPCHILNAFPNPFKNITSIRFSHPDQESPSKICVYDINGQLITEFKTTRTSGSFCWNGMDQKNTLVPPGVYMIVSQLKNELISKKVVKIE